MKKAVLFLLLGICVVATLTVKAKTPVSAKDPIVVEVTTRYTALEEALTAAKAALLKQKFIIDGAMGEKSFTAKRTTGAKADYYVADVNGTMEAGKAKVSISFVKIGTGLLKLQKVADAVKAELEK